MRARVTGLLLALTLLALAVPATLGCCFGPSGGGAHAQPQRPGYAVAAAVRIEAAARDADSAVHECADHPAPAQTPYIENNSGNGGRGTATSRGVNAAIDTSVSAPAAATVCAHRHGVAADATGPPLWLRTCVSRT